MAAAAFPTPEIEQWAQTWQTTRALTYDLLATLPYAVMNFSPHPGFGTLIRQIRHVGEIQACYTSAIASGRMDFAGRRRQRALEQSKERLEAFLREQDAALLAALREVDAVRTIEWNGTQTTLLQHLTYLLQHETLHHGMWVFYAKIAELDLPDSWRRAWDLT